jgi:hypothetical protein
MDHTSDFMGRLLEYGSPLSIHSRADKRSDKMTKKSLTSVVDLSFYHLHLAATVTGASIGEYSR